MSDIKIYFAFSRPHTEKKMVFGFVKGGDPYLRYDIYLVFYFLINFSNFITINKLELNILWKK